MTFDKTEYWERRKANKRGQGDYPEPKPFDDKKGVYKPSPYGVSRAVRRRNGI